MKSAKSCKKSRGVLLSISPLSMSSLISFGLLPSTWQPTLNAVPRISLTVPFNSFASDLNLIVRAISMISSRGMDLLCLIFFSFFRSRGGSFKALITRDDAEGTTETAAWRFWMVSRTVTRRPFCKPNFGQILMHQYWMSGLCVPNHQWPLRYLLRPSLVKDRGDQSWEPEQRTLRPHHQSLSGGYKYPSACFLFVRLFVFISSMCSFSNLEL